MAVKNTILLLVALVLASIQPARAQHRIYRVGVLHAGSPDVAELKGLVTA
jgi:hypothetical protein